MRGIIFVIIGVSAGIITGDDVKVVEGE